MRCHRLLVLAFPILSLYPSTLQIMWLLSNDLNANSIFSVVRAWEYSLTQIFCNLIICRHQVTRLSLALTRISLSLKLLSPWQIRWTLANGFLKRTTNLEECFLSKTLQSATAHFELGLVEYISKEEPCEINPCSCNSRHTVAERAVHGKASFKPFHPSSPDTDQ